MVYVGSNGGTWVPVLRTIGIPLEHALHTSPLPMPPRDGEKGWMTRYGKGWFGPRWAHLVIRAQSFSVTSRRRILRRVAADEDLQQALVALELIGHWELDEMLNDLHLRCEKEARGVRKEKRQRGGS